MTLAGRRLQLAGTICGCGLVDQVSVPYALRLDSDLQVGDVTGTGCTVFGWKSGRMLANAVMASATTMTAAPRPANIGRVDGRRMGRLKPKRGFAAGAV